MCEWRVKENARMSRVEGAACRASVVEVRSQGEGKELSSEIAEKIQSTVERLCEGGMRRRMRG